MRLALRRLGLTLPSAVKRPSKKVQKIYRQPSKLQINIYHQNQILLFMLILLASEQGVGGGVGARLSEISYSYDPPI